MTTSPAQYVIDASVLIAKAHPLEPHHAEADEFLNMVREKRWIGRSPNIVLAEVSAGIARGTGQPALALQVVALLQRLPDLEFVEIDGHLAQTAAQLAATSMIRGCDAVYIALAQMCGATLISLDTQQRTRAPSFVAARTPAEELSRLNQLADHESEWNPHPES